MVGFTQLINDYTHNGQIGSEIEIFGYRPIASIYYDMLDFNGLQNTVSVTDLNSLIKHYPQSNFLYYLLNVYYFYYLLLNITFYTTGRIHDLNELHVIENIK